MLSPWSVLFVAAACFFSGVHASFSSRGLAEEAECEGSLTSFSVNVLVDFFGRRADLTSAEVSALEQAFVESYNSLVACEQPAAFIRVDSVDITVDAADAVADLLVDDTTVTSQVRGDSDFTVLAVVRGECIGCDFGVTGTPFSTTSSVATTSVARQLQEVVGNLRLPTRPKVRGEVAANKERSLRFYKKMFPNAPNSPTLPPLPPPTQPPTVSPSEAPSTPFPSEAPSTPFPSDAPSTPFPSETPTSSPSSSPSVAPSVAPTSLPSSTPSVAPSRTQCNCPGPAEDVFLTTYNTAILELRQEGTLVNVQQLVGELAALEQIDCAAELKTFNTTVILRARTDLSVATPAEIAAMEASFRETYNDLNVLNGDNCDVFFRQILDVNINLTASLLGVNNQRRNLQLDTPPPTADPCAPRPPAIPTVALPTSTPSSAPSPPGGVVPTVPAPTCPTPAPSPGIPLFTAGFGVLLVTVTGQCRGCPDNSPLFNDVSSTRRQLHNPQRRRRRLQQSPECLCPTNRNATRAASEEEFTQAYSTTVVELRQEDQVEFVETIEQTVEVEILDCPTQTDFFETSVVLSLLGNVSNATVDQVTALEESFRDAYNSLNALNPDTCDLLFRRIISATFDLDAELQDAPPGVGGYTAVLVNITGRCAGCAANSTIFEEASTTAVRRNLPVTSKDRRRRLQEDAPEQCVCPRDPELRAPSEAEFLAVYNSAIDELRTAPVTRQFGASFFVESAEDVTDVELVECPPSGEVFETTIVTKFDGDFESATIDEIEVFLLGFKETYNAEMGILGRVCDPFNRRISSVSIDPDSASNFVPPLLLLRIEGTCDGCSRDSTLYDMDETRRGLKVQTPKRRLQAGASPICVCPSSFSERAILSSEFQTALSSRLRRYSSLGISNFVQELESVVNVDPVACANSASLFETVLIADFASSLSRITQSEVDSLVGTLKSTYNDLTVDLCDPELRLVESARVTSIQGATIVFAVTGSCQGLACGGSGLSLFEPGLVRFEEDLMRRRRLLGSSEYRRFLADGGQCFCNSFASEDRAPTVSEFFSAFSLAVESSNLPNVGSLLELDEFDATGVPSEEPTAEAPFAPISPYQPSRPSAPYGPSEPSQPFQPSAPYGPSEPSQPFQPSAPNGPSEPSQPFQPSTPSAPSGPSAPFQPSTPSAPSGPSAPFQPSTPSAPSEPSQPSTPSAPSQPSAPSEPSAPSQPSAPSEPSAPSQPSAPSAPSDPSAPSQPSAPSGPSAPSQPSAPSEPSAPSQPSAPSGPSAPSQPSAPSGPSAPSQPSAPSGPSAPSQPSAPSGPSAPSQPSAPSGPSAPSQPSALSGPSAPSQPSAPSGPSAPSQPSALSGPSAPSQPLTPTEAVGPSGPTSPF